VGFVLCSGAPKAEERDAQERKEHEIVINVIKSSRAACSRFPPVAAETARQEIEFHPGGTATGILLK
jgi:hypothetical protein